MKKQRLLNAEKLYQQEEGQRADLSYKYAEEGTGWLSRQNVPGRKCNVLKTNLYLKRSEGKPQPGKYVRGVK